MQSPRQVVRLGVVEVIRSVKDLTRLPQVSSLDFGKATALDQELLEAGASRLLGGLLAASRTADYEMAARSHVWHGSSLAELAFEYLQADPRADEAVGIEWGCKAFHIPMKGRASPRPRSLDAVG